MYRGALASGAPGLRNVRRVLPAVPLRQWVLSLPKVLRHLLAYDGKLCRAVAQRSAALAGMAKASISGPLVFGAAGASQCA